MNCCRSDFAELFVRREQLRKPIHADSFTPRFVVVITDILSAHRTVHSQNRSNPTKRSPGLVVLPQLLGSIHQGHLPFLFGFELSITLKHFSRTTSRTNSALEEYPGRRAITSSISETSSGGRCIEFAFAACSSEAPIGGIHLTGGI